jgi:hypothetical protein
MLVTSELILIQVKFLSAKFTVNYLSVKKSASHHYVRSFA